MTNMKKFTIKIASAAMSALLLIGYNADNALVSAATSSKSPAVTTTTSKPKTTTTPATTTSKSKTTTTPATTTEDDGYVSAGWLTIPKGYRPASSEASEPGSKSKPIDTKPAETSAPEAEIKATNSIKDIKSVCGLVSEVEKSVDACIVDTGSSDKGNETRVRVKRREKDTYTRPAS